MRPRKNIELKARCGDLDAARSGALSIGATPAGLLVQTDTYFRVTNGRLKLRETQDRPAELIWYVRADSQTLRDSDYYVLPIPDPQNTKAALTAALGVRGVIEKRRELLIYHNVRVHLDQVASLGTFIEFEAVISRDADVEPSMRRLETLTATLGIRDADRVAVSYSDLILS